MNLPNRLTVLRVVLIPFFVFFLYADFIAFNNYYAAAVFIIASLTDFLDGYIARKNNLVTNFGKFMDPLADKLLVVSALVCLLSLNRLPGGNIIATVSVLIIVAREFIISGFRLVAADNGIVIAASMWGKVKTATTMVAIILLLVVPELTILTVPADILFYIAIVLTVVSLVDYLVKNKNVLKETK
jgi:CDP-diacylglycerol--glycerol-3-phosphate 3-phosphatidyltransferase